MACGNTLHVHDLVDYVTEESKTAGHRAAAYACGKLGSASRAIPFVPSRPITYTVPQAVQPALVREDVTLRFRTNEVIEHARVIVRVGKEVVASFPKRMMAPGEMQTITIPLKKIQPYFDQADAFSIETEVREA